MVAPRGVAVAEAKEAEGTQPTAPPSMDVSLDHYFGSQVVRIDCIATSFHRFSDQQGPPHKQLVPFALHALIFSSLQVLGFSSFPPSPPSVPPDIRNWFSSYEYDSPDLSGLPFELGSSVADSAGFEKIRELRCGEHALHAPERSHSPSPERPTEAPNFEHLPISKGTHENSCSFNDERLVRERGNYNQIQTQRGGCAPTVGFISTGGDQRALNGSEGFVISECGHGDEESVLQHAMGAKTKHHELSKELISADNLHDQEYLDGRGFESSHIFKFESYNSEMTCEDYPRKEALEGDRCRQERDNVTAGGLMPTPHREDSKENAGDVLPGIWVSTRGGRRPSDDGDGNLRNGDSILKNRKQLHVEGHESMATRTALADRTNHPNGTTGETGPSEIVGKWKCPRRNKAERGPPLKQLRLECWVRRVV